ncbi:MAG: septal ring lytic transglycosylase RlpA family protein [Ignavibacteria bacterium]|nr:septal ring lytic transglycosylase RlpA family protein [Ignavibacteria bacterium]
MNKIAVISFCVLIFAVSGCGSSIRFTGKDNPKETVSRRPVTPVPKEEKKPEEPEPQPEQPAVYRDYSSIKTISGVASYYSSDFNGRQTASGETYRMNDLTAAHRDLPFNSILKITNLNNGKSVIVRVNDRGPQKPEREIDLSLGAAKIIGLDKSGICKVQIDVIKLGE